MPAARLARTTAFLVLDEYGHVDRLEAVLSHLADPSAAVVFASLDGVVIAVAGRTEHGAPGQDAWDVAHAAGRCGCLVQTERLDRLVIHVLTQR